MQRNADTSKRSETREVVNSNSRLLQHLCRHNSRVCRSLGSPDEFGGGFVPEDVADETGAGGFLVEDNNPPGDVAMLDIAGDDNKTTSDLPSVHDDPNPSPHATTKGPAPDKTDTATTKETTSIERSLTVNISAQTTHASTVQPSTIEPGPVPLDDTSMNEDVEINSDRDSLISHDPEDDDAEPDWLESD